MEQQIVQREISEIKWIDNLAALLDNRFRIPFTNIRFGVDFLIGLIPYAGDVISFSISSLLIVAMARHGASGRLMAKMIGNVILDTLVGAIPILGDIFDLFYKANRRNVHLLKEHYHEGEHQGSAWAIVLGVLAVLIGLFFLMVYLVWQIASWALNALGS